MESSVAPIIEKRVETRIRWFKPVERRPVNYVARRVDLMESSQIIRSRGRPSKTISETIRKDLKIYELDRDMMYDKVLWHLLIHIANPT